MDQLLSPAQRAEEGKRLYGEKQYREAARLFAAAADGYSHQDDALTAAEMRNNQSVALLLAGSPKDALRAVEGTPEIFARAGDQKRQAMAVGNIAAALEGMGKKEAALEKYTESARLLQEIGAGDEYTHVMQTIAGLKLKMKKPMGAFTSMQYGLEEVENPTLFQRIKMWLLNVFFKWFIKK